MIHDQGLVDQLSALATERFGGEVFRATGRSADPLAFSVNGGRWAPPVREGVDVPVLYTSTERDGALAEVVSYLALLTPLPLSRPLKVSRLVVSTAKTLRLAPSASNGWAWTWRGMANATTPAHRKSGRRSLSSGLTA
jgi:RES domain